MGEKHVNQRSNTLGAFFNLLLLKKQLHILVLSCQLVEETEAHVLVRLLIGFLLLGFFLSLSWGSSRACSSSGGGSSTASNIQDELLDIHAIKGLCEKAWPVWLHRDASSLQDGDNLVTGDGNLVISQDEGCIYASELVV